MNNVRSSSRLRAAPTFPLEFVEPRKDTANAGAQKPRRGKAREEAQSLAPAFAMSFPRLDELKRKNRDCL